MATVLLPRNLEGLAKIADSNPIRYALGGVHLRIRGEEYTVEATDGKVLVRVVGESIPAGEHPIQLDPLAGVDEALIPAREWGKAFMQVPKRGKEALTCLHVQAREHECALASTDLDSQNVQTVRNVEGRFPDCEKVIPKDSPRATVKLNVERLIQLLTALKPLTDDPGTVEVELRKPSDPVVFRCVNGEQKTTALLMPME